MADVLLCSLKLRLHSDQLLKNVFNDVISMYCTSSFSFLLQIPEGGTGDTGRERTKTFTYDFSYFSADSKSPSFVCQETVRFPVKKKLVSSSLPHPTLSLW